MVKVDQSRFHFRSNIKNWFWSTCRRFQVCWWYSYRRL